MIYLKEYNQLQSELYHEVSKEVFDKYKVVPISKKSIDYVSKVVNESIFYNKIIIKKTIVIEKWHPLKLNNLTLKSPNKWDLEWVEIRECEDDYYIVSTSVITFYVCDTLDGLTSLLNKLIMSGYYQLSKFNINDRENYNSIIPISSEEKNSIYKVIEKNIGRGRIGTLNGLYVQFVNCLPNSISSIYINKFKDYYIVECELRIINYLKREYYMHISYVCLNIDGVYSFIKEKPYLDIIEKEY